MDYGQIVSQGWKITWENKYLWVLGFLAALTSSRANSSSTNYSNEINPETFSPEQLLALGGALSAVVCFAFIVGIILWVVGLTARGGLITAVYKISNGKQMTLGQAFSSGLQRIWSLIGMNLLLYLPMFLVSIVIIGASFIMFAGAIGSSIAAESMGELTPDLAVIESLIAGFGIFFICFMMLCCVLVIVGICLQFINAFAYRGIMIHEMGVMQSISHSWNLIKQNFSEVLILSILFGILGIGFGILVGLLVFPVTLITMAPVIAGSMSGDISAGGIAYMMGAGLCLGVFGALFTAILVTWQSATFTLAYKEWTKKMGFSYADDNDDLDDIIEKSPT